MLLNDVIGQKPVKHRLVKMVEENRISHALLFLGAEGSGNLAMAIAFAQYVLCEDRGAHDSCGKCNACLKMGKLVHPDVTFTFPIASSEKASGKLKSVDFITQWRETVLEDPYFNFDDWIDELGAENKQGLIPVEESADIIRRLSLKAVEAPYRIVIIWLPEKMHPSAANKLLKIIEEPPDQTLFFLVSENYEQIMPTILSRTQLIKFSRLKDEEIADAMIKHHGQAKETALKLAHRSGGNYRDAINFHSNFDEEFNVNQKFIEWMRACLKLNLEGLNNMIDDLSGKGREKQKLFLRNSMHLLRECLMMNYADHSMIRFQGEELEAFKKFAPFIHANNSEAFVNAINDAHYHIERNANFKIVFTDLSFSLNKLLNSK